MWRDTHPPQQGIEIVQEITALNESYLDLPVHVPLHLSPYFENLESNW